MDATVGSAIGLLSGLVALVAGLIAVVNWLVEGRTPWKSGGVTIVAAAVLLVCARVTPPGYSADERVRVERLHAEFAPALERYRQAHGGYPPTLEAAGIATPQTEYGPLEYHTWRTDKDEPAYSVSFGDYARNGFTAYFDSRLGKWHLDS